MATVFPIAKTLSRKTLSYLRRCACRHPSGKNHAGQRRAHLHQADVHLEQLRLWMRFARDKQLLSLGQVAHFARMVTDVGKCLGAWIKNESGQR